MKQNDAPILYMRVGRMRAAVWLHTDEDGSGTYACRLDYRRRPDESLQSVAQSVPNDLPEINARIEHIIAMMRAGLVVPEDDTVH